MAPSTQDSRNRDEFLEKLSRYLEARGTKERHYKPDVSISGKPIDLFQLFNTVVDHGGYDKVSAEKLLWRKLGEIFDLGNSNLAASAFALKATYYYQLAAYEITTIHGKEPPPVEILEDLTPKGGDLLTRTVDNYRPSRREREPSMGQSGESGDDGTPVRESNGSEDAPGSGGRATRGLRQAPPQRVLFQPDTGPSRMSHRHSNNTSIPTGTTNLSQPPRGASTFHNPSSNPDSISPAVANYEPRAQNPLTLRPVITPASNPVEFAKRQRLLREAAAAASNPKIAPPQRMMLPGTGFDGPNIYVRCLLALKSGIPAEQDYALHHLVKISMERGDKFRFESFPGLAEALIEKMLEVSSLFYKIDWEISYLDDGRMHSTHTLDGMEGTKDILVRIASLIKKDVDDNIQTEEFCDSLLQINEAALTLRNMVMLEENALYVSEIYPLRDFLSIALNLPELDSVTELKHYALEIAEQLTKYLHLDAEDPLYLSLLAQLPSEDRGAILTALRSISRISMNLEESNRLQGIPSSTIQKIMDWTLLDDEELVHASLDFLYQYTAVVDNVDLMITDLSVDPLVNQLNRLLMHGAKAVEKEILRKPEVRRAGPETLPEMPADLLRELLKLDEPARSAQWLRCFFEEDKDEAITQIALWQAYQNRFSAYNEPGHQLLPAADFIKNVSTTFQEKATAQVQSGQVQRFIIKGIRIRDTPVDTNGKEYTKCRWSSSSQDSPNQLPVLKACEEYFMTPEPMYNHVLNDHATLRKDEEGKFINEELKNSCSWNGCEKYPVATTMKTAVFALHIKTHVKAVMVKTSINDGPTTKKKQPSWIDPAVKQSFIFYETAVDEHGHAAGIPLTALLVLRNLARNLPKTEAEEIALKDANGVSYVHRLFKPIEQSLWFVFAHNRGLAPYLSDLMAALSD